MMAHSIPLLVPFLFLVLGYLFLRRDFLVQHTKKQLAAATLTIDTLTADLESLTEKHTHTILYDTLTGLPGRQVFEDRLRQTLSLSKRNNLTFAVMLLQLHGMDHEINASVNEALTRDVAHRLEDSIRTIDTVSLISHDKFVFILAQLLRPETAGFVAQRVLTAITEPFVIDQKELFLKANIGISTFPTERNDNSVEYLMNSANIALQQQESENTYRFYSASVHQLSEREIKIATRLLSPDVYESFKLFYQPIIDIQTQEILYMDTLLFWEHPDLGLITSGQFIKLAENNGKMADIGMWWLKNALKRPFLCWGVTGIESVCVALSARQLESARFVHNLSMMLQQAGFDPSRLILQIPETALSVKGEGIEKIFNMLKHMGVKIVILFSCEGCLSIEHLQRLSMDAIKISAQCIKEIEKNPEKDALINLLVAVCKTKNIKLIAEGVDTPQLKAFLLDRGCIFQQGTLFCQPQALDNEG